MDKKDWFWTVVTFAGLIALVVIIKTWAMPARHVVVYDCRISETSPDFPIQVKEECRKLRSNK